MIIPRYNYSLLRRIFYFFPKTFLLLFRDKELINQPSYYPEREFHKSKLSIFIDQTIQIFKYGEPEHYYYMYGFDTIYKDEMDKYMPLRPFMNLRDKINLTTSKHNASCILRNKLYFGFFANSLGIKTGNNVALVVKNKIMDLKTLSWHTMNDLFDKYNGSLFCKKLDGECGKDIFVLEIKNGSLMMNGELIDINAFNNTILNSTYLLQEKVTQHNEMNRLYPKALNTIRLVTIKNIKTKEIRVFPSNLRIGAHGAYVDNGSQGGIAVGFDLETGQLYRFGLQKPPYGTKTEKHPDTETVFSSFTIPFIKEVKEQAIFLHSMLDGIYSIGWDIAITEEGPLFIEGNDNWELQAIQRTHGGLKYELFDYLGIDY